MRKPVLLIFVNAMILIVVFVLLAQSLFIVQRVAQVGQAQGRVEVQRGGAGEFKALASTEMVAVGDVVRTGKDGSAEFTWADKTRWKVAPNTRLTITKASANSTKKAEISLFRLDAGKVFVRIVKSLTPDSKFEIETPTAVAAVRGTVFSVEVENGKTRVETFAGHVKVTSAGREAMVDPGQEGIAGAGKIQKEGASGAPFRSQPDLIRPELKVRAKSLGGGAIVQGATEAGNSLTIDGQKVQVLGNGSFVRRAKLQPGHNQWTAQATDKHGAQSSECVALEYDAQSEKASEGVCK